MFGFHHHSMRSHPRFAGGRGGFGRGGSDWDMSEGARGGRGGPGGPGGRGGRRRVFEGSELRLVLLALLEAQPRHGYDLIREIEERTGGLYVPSPGVVYPALTMLDEMGQVDEVKEEGTRKRFALTDAGRAHLAERRQDADALLARLGALGEDRARTDRAPIGRAVANLHMTLRNAVAAGGTSRQEAIVAILDEAARRIERGE